VLTPTRWAAGASSLRRALSVVANAIGRMPVKGGGCFLAATGAFRTRPHATGARQICDMAALALPVQRFRCRSRRRLSLSCRAPPRRTRLDRPASFAHHRGGIRIRPRGFSAVRPGGHAQSRTRFAGHARGGYDDIHSLGGGCLLAATTSPSQEEPGAHSHSLGGGCFLAATGAFRGGQCDRPHAGKGRRVLPRCDGRFPDPAPRDGRTTDLRHGRPGTPGPAISVSFSAASLTFLSCTPTPHAP